MEKTKRPRSKRCAPGDPKKAIAYLRVSTSEQKIGPEAQKSLIESWAARAGVQVVSWHVDQGVSGSAELSERKGLTEALAAVRVERAGVLVIAKRDRLARDSVVAAMIDRAACSCGAEVVAADGAGNGSDPASLFMRQILDAASEYERQLIRARTKAALAVKSAAGERAGMLPYGFTVEAGGAKLVEHQGEQETIRRAVELRGAGHSYREIAKLLAASGHLSRAGTPLTLANVHKLVKAGEGSAP